MKDRSSLPRPPAAYWWCQFAGWGGYLLVNVLSSQGFISFSWPLVSGYAFLSAAGIFLSHAYRAFILRRGWLEKHLPRVVPRVLGANFLLALALVAMVTVYFLIVPPRGTAFGHHGIGAIVATWFVFVFNDFIIFTLWSGTYFGVAYFQRQRRLEIERYQEKAALSQAELRGLKNQLNPHFLFNSLNSLRALVVEDPARAQTAITQLAAILRYHLQSAEGSLVSLASELETVEQYLALELIRFEDRLTIQRQIDPAALDCLVPPLALQNLVENAIKYGVSREAGAGEIVLSAKVTEERLEISVRNSGALEPSPNESTGLGLTNLRNRLRLLFGEQAHFRIFVPAPGWVEALLVLPATKTLETTKR